MSGWRKCDTCRKVKAGEEFDGASPTCRACLTAPARRRSAPVTRTSSPRPAAPSRTAGGRAALGAVGMGDLEVRERRAKRAAWEGLAASHPEEFARLLRDARAAEGLRASSAEPSGNAGGDGSAAG